MDKAYFRKIEDSEQFSFSFRYENSDLKVNRQFNFVRQISEPLSAFLARLQGNMEKVIKKKTKIKDTATTTSTVNVAFTVNGKQAEHETVCAEIFKLNNVVQMEVLDKIFKVVINSPWIDSLSIPFSIMASFPVCPSKFEAFNTDLNDSDFIWSSSDDRIDWIEQGRGYVFTPSIDIINSYLKLTCTPKHKSLEGPTVEIECKTKIQAGPGHCPFETRHQFTQERTGENG